MKSFQSTDKLGLKELIAMGVGGMVGGGILRISFKQKLNHPIRYYDAWQHGSVNA